MTSPTPFDEPPTPAEIEAAKRFGVSVAMYRQFKRQAGPAAEKLETGEGPTDIVQEAQQAERMRREPGLFKRRDTAPNIFVEAAQTPGEVAKTLLTIFCYLVLLCLIVGFGGDKVQKVPGIFQVIGGFLLVIPAMMLSSAIWERIGEGARDVVRLAIRFWPLTLIAAIFLLGGVRMLFG